MKYIDKDMVLRVLQEEADLDGYEIDIRGIESGDSGVCNLNIYLRTGGSSPVSFCELERVRARILKSRTCTTEPVIAIHQDKDGPWLSLHFYHEYIRPEFFTSKKQ